MAPFQVRPGDVVIYETASRDKNAGIEYYYACEAIANVNDDIASAADGTPMFSVKAVYRPGLARLEKGNERLTLPRDHEKYDKQALVKALQERYGPGELITGFACDGKACGIKK